MSFGFMFCDFVTQNYQCSIQECQENYRRRNRRRLHMVLYGQRIIDNWWKIKRNRNTAFEQIFSSTIQSDWQNMQIQPSEKTGRVACTMNSSVSCQFCEIKILIQSQTKTSLERSRVESGRCQKSKAADVCIKADDDSLKAADVFAKSGRCWKCPSLGKGPHPNCTPRKFKYQNYSWSFLFLFVKWEKLKD